VGLTARTLAIAVAALLIAPACNRDAARPRAVLLVTLDTLRADRPGCYSGPVRTPTLDRLAAAGARFTQAVSAAPQTLPSHTAILTGRYPHVNGVRANGVFRLPDAGTTLAEILRREGFRTGAFVSAAVLDAEYGIDQGFDVYDDEMVDPLVRQRKPSVVEREREWLRRQGVDAAYFWHTSRKYENYQKRATAVTDAALEFVRAREGEPFFAWVHYFDPHGPYDPPEPFDELPRQRSGGGQGFAVAKLPAYQIRPELRTYDDYVSAYHGEIGYTDHELARLLEGLDLTGRRDDTLVIVTADHGESLDEHGYWFQHGDHVFDNELRVPLLVRWPAGVAAGRVVTAQVSTVDLFPTVLDLLGVEADRPEEGRSLAPLLRLSVGAFEERGVYSEAYIAEVLKAGKVYRSLRRPQRKLVSLGPIDVERPNAWIFDYESDPGENRPLGLASLSTTQLEAATEMLEELRSIASLQPIEGADGTGNRLALDDDTERKLQALGYLSPEPGGREEEGTRDDR